MRLRRLMTIACASAIAGANFVINPSLAATPTEVSPGMQVVDPAGGVVGTVTSVKGDALVLKTDKHEVQLPLTAFTASEGKLLFGMTAAELNAATDKAMAEASAAIAVGAQVYGREGAVAGQIEAVEAELITIKLTTGESIRLPRSAVGAGPNGVVLGLSAEELKQLAAQAGTGG